jgi:hypothetical protein
MHGENKKEQSTSRSRQTKGFMGARHACLIFIMRDAGYDFFSDAHTVYDIWNADLDSFLMPLYWQPGSPSYTPVLEAAKSQTADMAWG